MTPKVSVVLPMYNAAGYIEEAIASIREQTFDDFELLIIDDGSTDGSAAIAECHGQIDDRVFVHTMDHKGISHAMNFGLAKCRGEYVAIMHADDMAAQSRLERQLLFLETNPNIGVLGTAYRIVDENGKLVARVANPEHPEQCRAALWSGYNCICNHSAMVRKQAFERAGPYVQELWPSEDYDMWLRISEFTEIANLNECLETYRYHFENASYRRTLLQALTMAAALQAAESRAKGIARTTYEMTWEGLRRMGVTEEALFAQINLLYRAHLYWAIELGRHDVAFRLTNEFLTETKQHNAEKVGLEFLIWATGLYALKQDLAQIARLFRLSLVFGYSNCLIQLLRATCSKLWEGRYTIGVKFLEDEIVNQSSPSGYIDSIKLATFDDSDNTSTVRIVGWSPELSPYRNQTLVVGGVRDLTSHRVLRQDRPDVAQATGATCRCGFELLFDVQGKHVDPNGMSVAVEKTPRSPARLLRSAQTINAQNAQSLYMVLTTAPPRREIAVAGHVDELKLVPGGRNANLTLRVVGWAPRLKPGERQTVTLHGIKTSAGRTQIERRERPDAAAFNEDWLGSGFELSVEVEEPVDLSSIIVTITDSSGVTNRLEQP